MKFNTQLGCIPKRALISKAAFGFFTPEAVPDMTPEPTSNYT
jgi:hypothetical protein